MGIRHAIGQRLEAVLGRERTNQIRRAERAGRQALAQRLSMAPATQVTGRAPRAENAATPKPAAAATPKQAAAATSARPGHAPGRGPSDPFFVAHPKPTMSRHAFLRSLHHRTRPRRSRRRCCCSSD